MSDYYIQRLIVVIAKFNIEATIIKRGKLQIKCYLASVKNSFIIVSFLLLVYYDSLNTINMP